MTVPGCALASSQVPLSSFSPRVREWFEQAFAAPTPAQAQAWPAIARGEHVLVSAPTGSGKTLAAFLWALDRLSGEGAQAAAHRAARGSDAAGATARAPRGVCEPAEGARVRHRAQPAGSAARHRRGPASERCVRVGIRTGDTPQRERAAMLRNPPDILVTTPESLYLLLTSQARRTLVGVEAVIVDEIHAVAHSKRGSHLALTLERLRRWRRATDRPRDPADRPERHAEPARGDRPLPGGPAREVTIVDAGVRKQLDLRIEVPVESMSEPAARPPRAPRPSRTRSSPLPGGESTRGSIWPAIYPELLELVREHNSTIVFVNNRRSAERVALRLNELAAQERAKDDNDDDRDAFGVDGSRNGDPGAAPTEIARAHHGSLAREERTKVEELLKAGELPCLVATSSLELGIDMGAVDLVLQIESPKSVARGPAAHRPRRATAWTRSAAGASSRSSAATCWSARWWRAACTKA